MRSTTGDGSGFDQLLREAVKEPAVLLPKTSLLGGRFVIQHLLGSGGMGVVYRATDMERDSQVALKMLTSVDASGIYRLKQEFRALADVVHPNLVALHELFCDQDRWFFTMDLVVGDALLQMLHHETDDSRLRGYFAQLAKGIQAIHDAGKLHRDLKPTNVMLTAEGRVVILDFGLASDQETGGVGQTVLDDSISGTPQYMAPEQAAAQPATPASDWYAFGVMLFEALTGKAPFEGKQMAILVRKQQQDAPLPSSLRKGIAADLSQLCTRLLQRDPNARPCFQEVMQVLGAGTGGASATPSGIESLPAQEQVPFVGRLEELAALQDAFKATKEGHPVMTLVHGISGVGKTALVERFLQGLGSESNAVVLTGRCYERESVPFKAFDSLVDALSRFLRRLSEAEANRVLPREIHSLVRLFPALQRVEVVASAPRPAVEVMDPFEVRRRGFAALKEMLACIGDRQPLVLHVDDLQWGDLDSALLLQEVLGPPDPPPILFIGSYRRDEAQSSQLLQELLGSKRMASSATQVRMLAVDALDRFDTEELVHRLLGATRKDLGQLVETIVRESDGVPYFIGELVRYVESERGIEQLESGGKGALLQRLLMERIRSLPEFAQTLLEMISVAGRPIAQELALSAADIASRDAGVIHTLRSATLIRTRGPRLTDAVETYHDRIRVAVVSSLDPDRLRQCHARLAETLEASGQADAEWLLEQFQGTGERQKASEYAVIAADQADQAKAFTRAAELYRLALDLLEPSSKDSRYWELWAKLGDALANAGRGAEAAQAYLHPVSHASSNQALVLRRRAAEQYLVSGRFREGFALIRDVLSTLGMGLARTPLGALVSLLFWQAVVWLRGVHFRERREEDISADELVRIDTCWSLSVGLSMSDNVRGRSYMARFLLLALRSGEPYRVARALAMEGVAAAVFGKIMKGRATKLLQIAETLSKRLDYPHALGVTEGCVGISRYCWGEWRTAYEGCERAASILRERCIGVEWELATAQLFSLNSLFYLGEFRELSRRAPQLVEEAKQRGDLYAATNFRAGQSFVAWLIRDDVGRARQHLFDARTDWPFEGFQLQHYYLLLAEHFLDVHTGEHRAPWFRIRGNWAALKRSQMLWMQLARVEMGFLRATSALLAALHPPNDKDSGERRILLRIAERGARKLARENLAPAGPFADLIHASIAKARGNPEKAIALLASAAENFDKAEMAMHAAAARRQRGRLMGGDEGQKLIYDADLLMEQQTVKNVERMAAMLAPGFD